MISQFACSELVLAFDFDRMDDLFKSTAVVEQAYGQQEEAQAIDATCNSVEGREPG